MRLLEHWPGYLQELRELKQLAAAEQPELDLAGESVRALPLEFSVFTLTAAGIERWEKILGIHGMAADDLDSRRFRIQSRILEQIPITKRTLYTQLLMLCGPGGFKMDIDYAGFMLTVTLALLSKSALSDVEALLRQSAPANLKLSVSLMYNRHSQLKMFTHSQLSGSTYYNLRNEVLPNG